MNFLSSLRGLAGAAFVAVLGYVLAQFVGKQVLAYWELKKEIARCLVLYANADSTVRGNSPVAQEARAKFRELASALVGITNAIPIYGLWAWFRIVPTHAERDKARASLIGLSNSVGIQGNQLDNSTLYENIKNALRLRGSR